MKNTTNKILFDKYQLIKPLGHGSFSSVYLVRHISLDQERAIKIIPHDQVSSLSELSEVQLLKKINHPGIPQIYDIEKDELNYYIVEEYITGNSLDQLLLHQPIISLRLYINICEQLCDIFKYLHTFRPSPILYRDLKPEHIILCGNQIKLIDFNISSYVSNLGNNFKFYGNLNYSAPECFENDQISLSSDIYSLGKILSELYQHVNPHFSHKIQLILKKAINPDPVFRYETVEEFESELLKELSKSSETHLVKKIAVVGNHHGCGSTHIAISLVSTLNYLGYCATYYENYPIYDLQQSTQYLKGSYEDHGYIYYRFFKGIPAYGPGILLTKSSDDIVVFDYGADYSSDKLKEADLILYICGGAIWHLSKITDKINSLKKTGIPFFTICNLCSKKQSKKISRLINLNLLVYPFDDNPFKISKEKISVFKQLLNKNGGNLLSLKNTRKLFFQNK